MIKLDIIAKILTGLFVILVFFLFWALGGANLGGWMIVIFIAIFLLAIVFFFRKNKISFLWIIAIIILILVAGSLSGFIKTDLWDSKGEKEEVKQGPFRVSYSEGDVRSYNRGQNWVKITAGNSTCFYRIVYYVDEYPEISFNYKGDPSAYFNVSVADLNSPPNLIYEYGAVNFSETEKKYVKSHKKGGNKKDREILIKIVVPANTTVEITNFEVW